MNIKKGIISSVVVLVVGIQFIPGVVNDSPVTASNDFTEIYEVSDTMKYMLQTACYNCHSSKTTYSWYSHIQPIRIMQDHHVEEALEELNFNRFGEYSENIQAVKIEEMIEEIEEGEMPLKAYTAFHSEAEWSPSQKEEVIDFLKSLKKK